MKVDMRLLTIQILFLFGVFALALFLPAGTAVWPGGWAFLILFFIFTVSISRWLLRNNPALLNERMTGIGKEGQKSWDKVFYALANILFLGWLVLMALDAVRFRWSQMSGWLQFVGALLMLVSFYLFFLTFRENIFLSPAVRLQNERGHTVVSTGPYRYVRHPMYAAATVFMASISLLLGSWYGLAFVFLLVLLLAGRGLREEQTLREELPGYKEYMARVRYRLIPYIW